MRIELCLTGDQPGAQFRRDAADQCGETGGICAGIIDLREHGAGAGTGFPAGGPDRRRVSGARVAILVGSSSACSARPIRSTSTV